MNQESLASRDGSMSIVTESCGMYLNLVWATKPVNRYSRDYREHIPGIVLTDFG